MKRIISFIFAVLLLLFIAVPIAHAGDIPPGGSLRIEENTEGWPWGESDCSNPPSGTGGEETLSSQDTEQRIELELNVIRITQLLFGNSCFLISWEKSLDDAEIDHTAQFDRESFIK